MASVPRNTAMTEPNYKAPILRLVVVCELISGATRYSQTAHKENTNAEYGNIKQQNFSGVPQYSDSPGGPPSYCDTGSCHCGSAHRLNVPVTGHSPTPPFYGLQQQHGPKASYYAYNLATDGVDPRYASEQPDGEKGLGSIVAGGAAGGFAAHQMGGGKMATTGGALLGVFSIVVI